MNGFEISDQFRGLSVRDLLEARDTFHSHVAHLEHVVATAIGKYRARAEDVERIENDRPAEGVGPKTLENSVVRPWSWPCVLIFVDAWVSKEDFRQPDQFIPPYLYMPDGRAVPTCVILVEEAPAEGLAPELLTFPSELVGGGYPVVTTVQEQTQVASIGCLVTDGHTTYALTNAHVTGDPGQEVSTVFRGRTRRLGVGSDKRVTKKSFKDVYPAWGEPRAYVNLDAGLVRLDNLETWTAQVYGIGELGLLKDLTTDTYSLQLIGQPVCAFGAGGGRMNGEIAALFYRYRSVGGFDYIADLLIGPREGKPDEMRTRHGDSGTIWMLDEPPKQSVGEQHGQLRPIGLQWGGHRIVSRDAGGDQGSRQFNFALATALSNVCRELDVTLIRDWNTGHPETWGPIGHYLIGARACTSVTDAKLRTLLKANLERISFKDDAIKTRDLNDQHGFVALADVADIVWRAGAFGRQLDAHNHFADIDEPGVGGFSGSTLMSLTTSEDKLDSKVWNAFYDALNTADEHKGALPFRVWQIYNDMVTYVKHGRVAEFVCAAGILAHYVGDACQPLHVSRFHHGFGTGGTDPAHQTPAGISAGVANKVHSVFESDMLEGAVTAELIARVNARLKNATLPNVTITSGRQAGMAAITLMKQVFGILPPDEIVRTYNRAVLKFHFQKDRNAMLWQELGDRTADCMAAGTLMLAKLWQAAWIQGNGAATNSLGGVNPTDLEKLYRQRKFLEAVNLDKLDQSDLLTGRPFSSLVKL